MCTILFALFSEKNDSRHMARLDCICLKHTPHQRSQRHVPFPSPPSCCLGIPRGFGVPGEREAEVREGPLRQHDIDRREVEPCAASYFPLIRKNTPNINNTHVNISYTPKQIQMHTIQSYTHQTRTDSGTYKASCKHLVLALKEAVLCCTVIN